MAATAHRAATRVFALSVVVALVGCGSDATTSDATTSDTTTSDTTTTDTTTTDTTTTDTTTTDTATTDTSPPPLDGVTGELIITRQRDLLDRGLINVLVRNDSEGSMSMSDIDLVADFFTVEPAEQRTVTVRSGRQVAVQVPYGVAHDCDTDRPIAAELTFSSTSDDDPRIRSVRVELEGTDILDAIRARHCTARVFEAATRTRFDGVTIVDETLVTDLVIEPIGASADVAVEAVSGTILIGARTPDGWAGAHLDEGPVTIPLTFVVNRCDPHAQAEVTKRHGLDLAVSIDGAAPVLVAVDVAALVADLESIVDECVAAAAGD